MIFVTSRSTGLFHQETRDFLTNDFNGAQKYRQILRACLKEKHLPVTVRLMPTLLFGAEPSLVSIPVVITKLSRACRNTYCHETPLKRFFKWLKKEGFKRGIAWI